MTSPLHRPSPACVAALVTCGAALLSNGQAVPAAQDDRDPAKPARLAVYIGTYTEGSQSKGIYLAHLDMASGKLTIDGVAAETVNPSFLVVHPNRRYLYAVNEVANFKGTQDGSVSAFSIDRKTGMLTLLNQQSSRGGGPCHISVDARGRCVMVANYGTGSVAALPIKRDGSLGEPTAAIQHQGSSVNRQRQAGPHAHSINPAADNRFAVAADLGLDKVLVYKLDPAKGTLAANTPPAAQVPPGSGPRHFAFHPNGRNAYVINEMTSTVTAFDYDGKAGTLTSVQTLSTLPQGFTGNNSTAEVQVHPSGKFLYGSNRGHNSIAIFTIDEKTGQLTPAGHQPTGGSTPRNFGVAPGGGYLLAANQNSNDITVFRIDPGSGRLTQVGQPVQVPRPVCVKMFLAP